MKIEFDGKEIEAALIAKVEAMGIKANKCEIEISYSKISRATVWYEAPVEAAPNMPVNTPEFA